jgi:hypothetical protein
MIALVDERGLGRRVERLGRNGRVGYYRRL